MMYKTFLLFLVLVSLFTSISTAQDQPAYAGYSLAAKPIVEGLQLPIQAAQSPDGTWWVTEKAGMVAHLQADGTLAYPLDLTLRTNAFHERGLLGIAIGRQDQTWYMFLQRTVEYTPEDASDDLLPRTGQLIRYTLDADYMPILESETVILGTVLGNVTQPSCNDFPQGSDCLVADGRTHAPGTLQLVQDGDNIILFSALGEGAEDETVNDNGLRSQNLDSLSGKIVRIDYQGQGLPDNPFFTGNPSENRSKIFSYGHRNPYTFATLSENQVAICDVGAQGWEEINIAVGGENFGWPFREGPNPNNGYIATYADLAPTEYVDATINVDHQDQGGAIVCGNVLTDVYGPLSGSLLYGGFGWQSLHLLNLDSNLSALLETAYMPATFVCYANGQDGHTYGVDIMGNLSKLELIENAPLRVFTEPTNGYVLDIFDNTNLSGQPVESLNEAVVDYEWGETEPFGLSFDDNFSIRAYSTFEATFDSNYTVTAFVDDGIRIFLDDTLILDEWHDSSGTYYEVTVPVEVGLHTLRFEYYEGYVTATLKLNYFPSGE